MIEQSIMSSLKKGFVDKEIQIDEALRSRFLINDINKNKSVLETIKNELKSCQSFTFSVAFITESGLNELKTILNDLKDKNVSGRLLTSNYLFFNSPKVFKQLLKIKNIEVRVSDYEGYHAKGYLFEHKNYQTLVLGSSNLTSQALKVNHEWNLKISSLDQGEVVTSVKKTIEDTFKKAQPLTADWIEKYSLTYQQPNLFNEKKVYSDKGQYGYIVPNKMQENALLGIENLREEENKRGLVVSATGERVIIVMGAVCVMKPRVSGTLNKYISCIA